MIPKGEHHFEESDMNGRLHS